MLGEPDGGGDAFSGGGQVFSPNPPPFTEDMFAPKKQKRSLRRPLLIGVPAVAVIAAAGVIAALTLGGKSPSPAPSPTVSAAGSSAAAVVLPNCPPESAVGVPASARWTLAGNGADCSVAPAAANSLKLAHGAAWTTSAPRGKVLGLSSGNAVATVANSGFLNTANGFTVSVWVYLDTLDTSKYSTVVALQGDSIDAFRLEYNPGWGGWAFNRSSTDSPKATWVAAGSKTAPKTQTWTHLVGVYDSSAKTMTLYVNGTQAAQSTGVTAWNADSQIALGADIYQNGTAYNGMLGKLSDLQIFDAALSPQQIAGLS
jgi:Concanavalin A-like lectin/glucanases superfamily